VAAVHFECITAAGLLFRLAPCFALGRFGRWWRDTAFLGGVPDFVVRQAAVRQEFGRGLEGAPDGEADGDDEVVVLGAGGLVERAANSFSSSSRRSSDGGTLRLPLESMRRVLEMSVRRGTLW
jgi:hypothetical protein